MLLSANRYLGCEGLREWLSSPPPQIALQRCSSLKIALGEITMKLGFICLLPLVALTIVLPLGSARANDVEVKHVALKDEVVGSHVMIEFDLSWENSWRNDLAGPGKMTPFNYDAAWLFVKFSTDGGATWSHATLSSQSSNHSVTNDNGVAAAIKAVSDRKGVFIFRAKNGAGANNWDGVRLRWNYEDDEVESITPATIVNVFAIEMVFVPKGSFQAGDHATSVAAFRQESSDTDPWKIKSESAIKTGSDDFFYVSAGNAGEDATGSKFSIPKSFPKGYDAFYMMKHELTQGQYADFLNLLPRPQQNARTATQSDDQFVMSNTSNASFRNGIRAPSFPGDGAIKFGADLNGNGIFEESTDGENLACNFLSWADDAAYADWAGLRPMTELEYEKACRGASESPWNKSAVAGEYAWGNIDITAFAYALAAGTAGNASEVVSNSALDPTGNAAYQPTIAGGINGPLRAGLFATGSSTRNTAGASFYGVMELSGNNAERVVTVGNAAGRKFTDKHGDGKLDANGNANVSNWPGTSGLGAGIRGGGWRAAAADLRVSDRRQAALANNLRDDSIGFRAVRTAP
jgi:formylglycine-generating enzyme required for sulfatase activity